MQIEYNKHLKVICLSFVKTFVKNNKSHNSATYDKGYVRKLRTKSVNQESIFQQTKKRNNYEMICKHTEVADKA